LRREIEPVTTAEFMRFLLRWQHLEPGSQLHAVDGTLQVIQQLQGYEISAAAWEADVLPRRVARYDPAWLDRLTLSGEVVWGRLSPHPAFERREAAAPAGTRVRPTRVAPLTLFLRDDAEWLVAAAGRRPGPDGELAAHLSHGARAVLAELERRGASFFAELQRATGRLPSEVEDAVWELVAAGLVTADGFENLRALVDPRRRRGEGRARHARPRHAAGRWALLAPVAGADEDPSRREKSVEAFARQLLRRWGVVFRDLLARESLAPAWRDLLVVLRRMEARGEVRGGRFVSGFTGEQFARPEAIELLRAVRRAGAAGGEIDLSPADPLNLVGIVLPGPRASTLSGPRLRLRDGIPVEVLAAASSL
jgi:ATP-dependent Lhr-like helicase